MKRIGAFRFMQFALASAAAALFLTGTASAQTASYRFSLPYEAHWGLATLPAGDYSLSVEGIGAAAMIRVNRGSEAVAYMVVQNYDNKTSKRCALTVVRNGEGNFVRDLTVPQIGEVFHFGISTHGLSKEEELARVPASNGTK